MNFALKQSLKIFLTSLAILIIAMIIIYYYSYNNISNDQLEYTESLVEEISGSIEQHILEKVKTTKAITIAPVIMKALNESNAQYNVLPQQVRSEEIQSQNESWKAIENYDDPFILKYTNNPVSQYLKSQQDNLKGEYGEIFITNKYGALVASTAKLTTFAHENKYWWKGAYNNGVGAVFFDDRGYDDSVGGYVLGIVVPIKKGNEIIGILKANLNILGSISELILNSQNESLEKLKLIRSGGLIVFEEGVEPLSKRVPIKLLEKVRAGDEVSFILQEQNNKWIIGASEIGITSNIEGYHFGGSFESIDHKKGNTGESWYIVDCRSISNIVEPVQDIIRKLILIGLLLSIVIALTSLIIGNRTAQPIKELMVQAKQIAKGDFESRVSIKRNDEIGLLAASFNQMAKNLNDTTTSIEKLNMEIAERKQAMEEIEKLAKFPDENPNPILRISKDGTVLYHNKGSELLLDQWQYQEGKSLSGKWSKLVRESFENNEVKYEETEIAEKVFSLTFAPIIEKDFVNIYGLDITERKHAAEALLEANKIINRSPAVAFLWKNEEGWPVEFVSENAVNLFGYSAQEFLERKISYVEIIHSDDIERVAGEIARYSKKECPQTFAHKPYRIITKKGEVKWINDISYIRRDSQGIITHYEGIVYDITERKQAEEELKINRERLKTANSILRHDITNDLVVIKSAVDIYREEHDETMIDEIEKRVEKSIKTIRNQREQEAFINAHAVLDEYDIEQVASDVIKNYPDTKITVTGTSRAYADKAIYSVFENIISNAIRHSKTTKLDIDIICNNEICEIKFTDYGIGIPDEIKDKIFDEGFHYGKSGHTGIGLYIVQKTVEEYGGMVFVEDNTPQGAVFIVRLKKALKDKK